jgi:shikimate kinase
MNKNNFNVIISGFMGTGKTTIGKKIALRLNKKFIDTDQVLENYFNKSIKSIFRIYGEKFFHKAEQGLCLKTIVTQMNCIISLGGGFVLPKEIIEQLNHCYLFCFNATPDVILKRVFLNNKRPLINKMHTNKLDNIKNLLIARKKNYANIANQINIGNLSINYITSQIIKFIS